MPIFGFLNINKPAGMTSHDVVAKIRRGLNIRKVGHAGTLDPLATGVLVICLGGATRLSDYIMHGTKRYTARVHLGITTDTYDTEGAILEERDATAISREDVERALTALRGDIRQIPPMYSAIKQGGRKLYDLARAGQTVEREARAVTITALDLLDWQPPRFTLDVVCSAGTYIRSLAYDLGETLGVGAHLAGLTRTASGNFTLENAVELETLVTSANWQQSVISPQEALAGWPSLQLDDASIAHIQHGRGIEITDSHLSPPGTPGDTLFAYTSDGTLLAILEQREDRLYPRKVFLPGD
jgi:tRNA pseudouridine55 synthase